MIPPLDVFCCYAREDQEMLAYLRKHLAPLVRQGKITVWSDGDLSAGVEWQRVVHDHLERADLILLLISPDFMNSDYCYSTEMSRAIERHQQGGARVIPILLRHAYWRDAPFAVLQMVPRDARPVKSWPDLDEAFNDVTERISQSVTELRERRADPPAPMPEPKLHIQGRSRDEWLAVGKAHHEAKRYQEALAAYEQAIQLDPVSAVAYTGKGRALNGLGRCIESLAACEQALRLDSTSALAQFGRGYALNELRRNEEALAAFERAITLDPTYALAYSNKGNILIDLGRNEEALAACEQAIALDPTNAATYQIKGIALSNLGKYVKAQQAYAKAKELGYQG